MEMESDGKFMQAEFPNDESFLVNIRSNFDSITETTTNTYLYCQRDASVAIMVLSVKYNNLVKSLKISLFLNTYLG